MVIFMILLKGISMVSSSRITHIGSDLQLPWAQSDQEWNNSWQRHCLWNKQADIPGRLQNMQWSSAHSSITNTHVNTLSIPIFLYPFKEAGNKWSPAEVMSKNKGSSSASCRCLLFSFLSGACQLLVILAKHMIRVLEQIQTANKQAHLEMNTHKLVAAQYFSLFSRSCTVSSNAR